MELRVNRIEMENYKLRLGKSDIKNIANIWVF